MRSITESAEFGTQKGVVLPRQRLLFLSLSKVRSREHQVETFSSVKTQFPSWHVAASFLLSENLIMQNTVESTVALPQSYTSYNLFRLTFNA